MIAAQAEPEKEILNYLLKVAIADAQSLTEFMEKDL